MADSPVVQKKAKKIAAKPTHPAYAVMITAAVDSLKERSGSSRQAILKYVIANYSVGDEKKAGVRIKMALKKGVASGALKQVKGAGASGSFKIAKEEDKPVKKTVAKKPAAKKSVAKKAVKKLLPKKAVKKPATKKPSPKKAAKKPAPKKAAKKTAAKKPAPKKAKKVAKK